MYQKIRGRVIINVDEIKKFCDFADKFGDGHIFHHTYTNNHGQLCNHLSEFNTRPLTDKEWAKHMNMELEV